MISLKRLLNGRSLLVALVIAQLAGSLALWYSAHQGRERLRELEWELALMRHQTGSDLITLDVGGIQFLNNGYSIALDEVSYGPAGVTIAGAVGNPHVIELSSLTLEFSVNRAFQAMRDRYLENPYAVYFGRDYAIGSSQVSVGLVPPGASAPFRTLIPNVRQGQGEYEVSVRFSGERYQYPR